MMTRNLKISKRIKFLVGESRISEAIDLLEYFVIRVNNKDLLNQFTVIKSRKSSEIIKFINGIKEGDISDNNINFAINLFTDKVEKVALEKPWLWIDYQKYKRFIISFLIPFLIGWGAHKIYTNKPFGLFHDRDVQELREVEKSNEDPYSFSSKCTPTSRERITNGKVKAIIELGASSFDYSIVKVDESGGWNLLKYCPSESYAKEGYITKQNALLKLEASIIDLKRKKVRPENIHFVVSSGALMSKKVNMNDVIKYFRKQNYRVKTVTIEEEAKYGLVGSTISDDQCSYFFVDIGSGNIKIAWYSNGKPVGTGIPLGSMDSLSQKKEDLVACLKEIALKIPVQKRRNCILIGGAPYLLARSQKAENEKFTKIDLKKVDLAQLRDSAKIEKAAKGKLIVEALEEILGCNNFYFDWDHHFSIGYLVKEIKY